MKRIPLANDLSAEHVIPHRPPIVISKAARLELPSPSRARPARVLVVPGRGETVGDLRGSLDPTVETTGINFDEHFARLNFTAQVERVAALLSTAEADGAHVVGRSFGAWLILQALIERTRPFVGTVVLIAPVLGYGGAGPVGFIAPRARTFWRAVDAGRPLPASRIVLIAARDDTQCPIDLTRRLAARWPIDLHECEGGHALGTDAGHRTPLISFEF